MKKNSTSTWVLGVAMASMLAISQPAALAESGSSEKNLSVGRSYGVGYPVVLEQLPTSKLRNKLDSLPKKSRDYAKQWMDRIRFHDRDLPFMRVDDSGGVYFADTELAQSGSSTVSRLKKGVVLPAMAPADAFRLHSRPGVTQVIYLDFTGHVITNTAWNSNASTLTAVAYDLDGNPGNFSALEVANIAEVWRRVSEDYAPFDVDVTTEEPASFGPAVARLLVTSDIDANGQAMPGQGAGGVGYVGVWGRSDYASTYSPAMVYYNRLGNGRADYVAEAAAHEMGHNLGLSHDATSTTDYYGGHGTGYTSWGPIMGVGYGRDVSQWSKGEYPDANQFQDDTAIISSRINYCADDHGNTRATATALVVDATGQVMANTPMLDPYDHSTVNKGVISQASDVDVFRFVTTGGSVTLQATPAREVLHSRGGDLDVLLSLYNSNGTLLTSSNPPDDTDAGISLDLAAGTYYLSVQGTGSANYSNYGSLGQYFIEGVLPIAQNNDTQDSTAPSPNPMGWAVAPQALGRDSISMTAVTAVDDTAPVEYRFECVAGSNGCVDSAWQASSQYVANGLDMGTAYSFRVKARDGFGNETVSSAEASATTLANKAPVAVDDQGSVDNTSSLSLNVLVNDSDPDGDTLILVHASPAAHGTVSISGGKVVYTPASGYVGADSFTYRVVDTLGASATASVTLDVTASTEVNLSPTAMADRIWALRGKTVTIPVLINDIDPEQDTLTIGAISHPYRGTATHDGQQITYTAGNKTGFDMLYYLVRDGHGNRAFTWVMVYIR